jgi:hypothetical protein
VRGQCATLPALQLLVVPLFLGVCLSAPPECDVSADFVERSARFATWPGDVLGAPSQPFVICRVGDDRTGAALEGVVGDRKISGRRIEVRSPAPGASLVGCHLVWVACAQRELPRLFGMLRGKPVLTMSAIPGFAESGGHIQLEKVDDRVRPAINLHAVRAAGLELSSMLLRQARIVKQ